MFVLCNYIYPAYVLVRIPGVACARFGKIAIEVCIIDSRHIAMLITEFSPLIRILVSDVTLKWIKNTLVKLREVLTCVTYYRNVFSDILVDLLYV